MPPRDPKAIRLLKNDKAHAHRYADREEPEPSNNRPQAPSYLSVRAAEIFEDFVKRIEEMYPASETDMDIMVLYANNKEQLECYELLLRENGSTFEIYSPTTEFRDGELIAVRKRPEVSMLRECKALQLRIITEFGLSPSSRTRVDLKKRKSEGGNSFAGVGKKKSKPPKKQSNQS